MRILRRDFGLILRLDKGVVRKPETEAFIVIRLQDTNNEPTTPESENLKEIK